MVGRRGGVGGEIMMPELNADAPFPLLPLLMKNAIMQVLQSTPTYKLFANLSAVPIHFKYRNTSAVDLYPTPC